VNDRGYAILSAIVGFATVVTLWLGPASWFLLLCALGVIGWIVLEGAES